MCCPYLDTKVCKETTQVVIYKSVGSRLFSPDFNQYPDSVAFVLCHLFKCVPPVLHKTVDSFMKTNDGGKTAILRMRIIYE